MKFIDIVRAHIAVQAKRAEEQSQRRSARRENAAIEDSLSTLEITALCDDDA